MKIISMDRLTVPPVMDLYIWLFLVPDKRFKSHKLRQFDGFVPRKRFSRDKGTIYKRLKRCLSNIIQI